MSAHQTTSEGGHPAAELLHELLSVRPAYRRRWEAEAVQATTAAVNQAAVARVLAAHQRHSVRVAPGQSRGRPLKDVVSRALSGRVLSEATLTLFIDAFGMSADDAARLRQLRQLRPLAPVPDDSRTPRPTTPRRRSAPSARYRTVTLQASHELGPDGTPRATMTVHVVRAVDHLARYRYILEPGVRRLEVVRGGVAALPYPVLNRTAVDIVLDHPLLPGETGSVQYLARYAPGTARPPVFRRGARGRLENVEVEVRFHPLHLPERVWWAIWPGLAGPPAPRGDVDDGPVIRHPRTEEVDVGPDGAVRRFVPLVQDEAVGFRWRFPA